MAMQIPTFSIQDLESRLVPHRGVVPTGTLPFLFGNTPELASTLASLVATGQKTATGGLLGAWETDEASSPHEAGRAYGPVPFAPWGSGCASRAPRE
jgi:hypothetical protein